MKDRQQFQQRVEGWATRLRVRPARVHVQPMFRKWGSCSSLGRLCFARDLLDQPADFQDYVIVHELLHLRIRNHGKLFSATLRAHLRGNRWLCTGVHGVLRQDAIGLASWRQA